MILVSVEEGNKGGVVVRLCLTSKEQALFRRMEVSVARTIKSRVEGYSRSNRSGANYAVVITGERARTALSRPNGLNELGQKVRAEAEKAVVSLS